MRSREEGGGEEEGRGEEQRGVRKEGGDEEEGGGEEEVRREEVRRCGGWPPCMQSSILPLHQKLRKSASPKCEVFSFIRLNLRAPVPSERHPSTSCSLIQTPLLFLLKMPFPQEEPAH